MSLPSSLPKLNIFPKKLIRLPAEIAHEFANTLNAVTMNAEIARMLADDKAYLSIHDALERTLESCQQANHLIEDLYHYAEEIQACQFEEITSVRLIENAIGRVVKETSCKPDFILIEPPFFSAPLFCIIYMLEEAFSHIMKNALARNATRIKITSRLTIDEVEINFHDNGFFDDEELAFLNKPCDFSINNNSQKIFHEIIYPYLAIKAHGGNLWLKNTVGRELTTALVLPRANR